MILKKLNDSHYVILADEKTLSNNGDWYLSHPDYNKAVQWNMPLNTQHEGKQVWINKILYSTQPLEILPCKCQYGSIMTSSHPCKKECQNPRKDYNKIKRLSLTEVEEAIYGYSMEKAAYNFCDNVVRPKDETRSLFFAFCTGFSTHQELVKDKLFTVEDMKKSFNAGYDLNTWEQLNIPNDEREYLNEHDYIQSLLPKTEWNVTFDEQGKIKLI